MYLYNKLRSCDAWTIFAKVNHLKKNNTKSDKNTSIPIFDSNKIEKAPSSDRALSYKNNKKRNNYENRSIYSTLMSGYTKEKKRKENIQTNCKTFFVKCQIKRFDLVEINIEI